MVSVLVEVCTHSIVSRFFWGVIWMKTSYNFTIFLFLVSHSNNYFCLDTHSMGLWPKHSSESLASSFILPYLHGAVRVICIKAKSDCVFILCQIFWGLDLLTRIKFHSSIWTLNSERPTTTTLYSLNLTLWCFRILIQHLLLPQGFLLLIFLSRAL